MMVFTANPEDYTARGKIITPLKDRIGSEIQTHYPEELETGVAITLQEAWIERDGTGMEIEIPDFLSEVVEQIAFLARRDKRVDQRSGVSQRMPISVMESLISNAERRALLLQEELVVPRIGDVYAALPAITGKMELEYEGELHGADRIAAELIGKAAGLTFERRAGGVDLEDIVEYFETGGALQVADDAAAEACVQGFETVPGLLEVVERVGLAPSTASAGVRTAACELVLEALVVERRISRSDGGYQRARPEPREKPGFQGFDPFSA
jgi:magnesium chelatase subunit I